MSAPTRCPSCGGVHREARITVVLGSDALERLGRFLDDQGWRRLVLVADANTHEVLGARLAEELRAAGFALGTQVFAARRGLLANEATVERTRAAIASSGAQAALAVGSGTLNDVTRHASFLERVPYLAVPTAASMDGYASSVAALQLGGVKLTFSSQAPAGIFADPGVLAAAPREMAVWGLGDLAGKASASFDWRLGHAVTGEAFCPAIEARVLSPLRTCLRTVPGLLAGESAPIETLFRGLVESGIAMTMQGDSRPASGCEHHASHFWDLLAYRGLRAPQAHGLQVGYATGIVVVLQRALLAALGAPLVRTPGQDDAEQERWLGRSEALAAVAKEKAAAFSSYASGWPPPEERLAATGELLQDAAGLFGEVLGALRLAGVPAGPGGLGVDRATLRATLRYANRLRNRLTTLDVLESQGRLEREIEACLGAEADDDGACR